MTKGGWTSPAAAPVYGTRIKPEILLADRMRALGDPNRLRLLAILAERELSTGELVERLAEVTQSVVSHHLRVLRLAGFVSFRTDGSRHLYRVKRRAFGDTASHLRRYARAHPLGSPR